MSRNSTEPSRGQFVVIEEPTEPRPTTNPAPGRPGPVIDERVVQPLMIPLAMIVSHELCDGSSKVALADRYDPIETFLFNGSHKAFGVRIWRLIRRLHDTDPVMFHVSADVHAARL